MSRSARAVMPGVPHHITQRGIRRFEIFRDSPDRVEYLRVLHESCRLYFLTILSYCLMTNHVHFIAVPDREDSLYRVFHRAHGIYAQKFNAKYSLAGHLWQDRPYSCVLDERHFWNAVRYVEQNPVRAGMVSRSIDYPWSSAAARCGFREDPLVDARAFSFPAEISLANGADWLDGGLDSGGVQLLRDCTLSGRPCGEDSFVRHVAATTHRDFTRKKRGPKPKPASVDILPDCSENLP